ncbi:helix-turn-helix domain-containing protein [Formosa agariphila]|uniref:helix-turn-helix domain-containing protein n=1 Tax=Formosa agariphila TaxID=320324 RepID=UPI000A0343AD|nr:helix-turn-helix domain-containing protein [Formosa agariphila]
MKHISNFGIFTLLLLRSDITIKELAFVLGFDSMSSFSRFFKKFTTVNPSTYRLNHRY